MSGDSVHDKKKLETNSGMFNSTTIFFIMEKFWNYENFGKILELWKIVGFEQIKLSCLIFSMTIPFSKPVYFHLFCCSSMTHSGAPAMNFAHGTAAFAHLLGAEYAYCKVCEKDLT